MTSQPTPTSPEAIPGGPRMACLPLPPLEALRAALNTLGVIGPPPQAEQGNDWEQAANAAGMLSGLGDLIAQGLRGGDLYHHMRLGRMDAHAGREDSMRAHWAHQFQEDAFDLGGMAEDWPEDSPLRRLCHIAAQALLVAHKALLAGLETQAGNPTQAEAAEAAMREAGADLAQHLAPRVQPQTPSSRSTATIAADRPPVEHQHSRRFEQYVVPLPPLTDLANALNALGLDDPDVPPVEAGEERRRAAQAIGTLWGLCDLVANGLSGGPLHNEMEAARGEIHHGSHDCLHGTIRRELQTAGIRLRTYANHVLPEGDPAAYPYTLACSFLKGAFDAIGMGMETQVGCRPGAKALRDELGNTLASLTGMLTPQPAGDST